MQGGSKTNEQTHTMTRPLLAVACALASAALTAQSTLYVKPGASGDGTSWETPAGLHAALAKAPAGASLWVAQGTYRTSDSGNRAAAFVVPSGVSVFGGFRGGETDVSERRPSQHPTTLSGEIGTPERVDNAYTVVRLTDADGSTVLDGLTIAHAYANGAGPVADPRRAGGGLLVDLSRANAKANPLIRDCVFEDNYARDGGAVYIDGAGGRATPTFVDCRFRENEADLDGGAVYNDGRRHGEASPIFRDCVFAANEANYGAAVFNQATKGTASPRLSDCRFADNRAYVRGTTVYSIDHQGESTPVLNDCVFDDGNAPADAVGTFARSN